MQGVPGALAEARRRGAPQKRFSPGISNYPDIKKSSGSHAGSQHGALGPSSPLARGGRGGRQKKPERDWFVSAAASQPGAAFPAARAFIPPPSPLAAPLPQAPRRQSAALYLVASPMLTASQANHPIATRAAGRSHEAERLTGADAIIMSIHPGRSYAAARGSLSGAALLDPRRRRAAPAVAMGVFTLLSFPLQK